jgi:hypothetical protein
MPVMGFLNVASAAERADYMRGFVRGLAEGAMHGDRTTVEIGISSGPAGACSFAQLMGKHWRRVALMPTSRSCAGE